MKNIIVFVAMALIFTMVCPRVQAMFALDPDKDMKVIEKEVVNEDGTTSIVKEVIITKRPIVQGVEVPKTDGSPRNKKIQHARGWDRKLGKYEPKDPMFAVATKRPKDWPIPEIMATAKSVPTTAATRAASQARAIMLLVMSCSFRREVRTRGQLAGTARRMLRCR